MLGRGLGDVASTTLTFGAWLASIFAPTPVTAVPPAPPQSLWTVAPANEAQANQVVSDLVNQQMVNQQAVDANQITSVSTFGVPSSLYDGSINWSYVFIGLLIGGVFLLIPGGPRRYGQ